MKETQRKGSEDPMHLAISKNIQLKEAWDKVTGKDHYTDNLPVTGIARLLTSLCRCTSYQQIRKAVNRMYQKK